MHTVVAKIAGPVVMEPPPAAVKSIAVERPEWSGPEPEIVIDAGGGSLSAGWPMLPCRELSQA